MDWYSRQGNNVPTRRSTYGSRYLLPRQFQNTDSTVSTDNQSDCRGGKMKNDKLKMKITLALLAVELAAIKVSKGLSSAEEMQKVHEVQEKELYEFIAGAEPTHESQII